MLSIREKKDKLIRATDLDALSCRHCANQKGYFVPTDTHIQDMLDSYEQNLPFCHGYTALSAGRALRSLFNDPKYPLINRGTYFRTKLINTVVERFISSYEKCQIVSLGGGSDTRAFRVLEEHGSRVKYMEIDFAELVKIKKWAIMHSPVLLKIVGLELQSLTVKDKQSFIDMEPELHTPNYDLVALDLREIDDSGDEAILAHLNDDLPTLVISECVLCYLTPEDNEKIVGFWRKKTYKCGNFDV